MSSEVDSHDLICKLKDMAIELGRVPTSHEFRKAIPNGRALVTKHFGSHSIMVIAAGLEPNSGGRKINDSIFEVDIDKHISEYKPAEPIPQDPIPTTAIISDIHWPFSCQRVIDRFVEYCGDEKPSKIILNGDAWDMYSHSKFPRSLNIFTPREEEQKSRLMNEEFWKKLKQVNPNAECTQMLGNHELRVMKRILESYPEAEDWIKERVNKLFTFDGVKTFFDPREELFLNSQIIVFHGYRSKLGDHRDFTLYSTINGHSHVGGVVFRKIRGQTLFELNSGLAGDPLAKGLTYTPQRITNWTNGFGVLNKYGPQFVSV